LKDNDENIRIQIQDPNPDPLVRGMDLRSVGDPGCLSRILIFTHPGSRIQKQQQKTGVKKKLAVILFLCSHKFDNIVHYFSFDVLKRKIWVNFQIIIELFTQTIVTKIQKYGFVIRDPRSGIRKKPIPDPGARGQKGTRSRIWIRNTGFADPDPH
jgi:hypothetical protein